MSDRFAALLLALSEEGVVLPSVGERFVSLLDLALTTARR